MREVALETSLTEEQLMKLKPKAIIDAIVADLEAFYERKAKAIADSVRPTMERIYEDRKNNMDMRIAFPLTDGRLRYTIPVELQKCKDTDCAEIYRVFAKIALFTTIDDAWREHLREMDDLRQSVQNATYEQKDPLLIYKLESFQLFSKMLEDINRDVLALLNKVYLDIRDNSQSMEQAREQRSKIDVNKLQASRMAAAAQAGQGERGKTAPIKVDKSVGRNDPCPCGSGKKYKHCHGKL
jgi:preprotein translocase subunit SecA